MKRDPARTRMADPMGSSRPRDGFVHGSPEVVAIVARAMDISLNSICPGRVETPFVQARISESPDPALAARGVSATQLIGCMIKPDDVANAALYLASIASARDTDRAFRIEDDRMAGSCHD